MDIFLVTAVTVIAIFTIFSFILIAGAYGIIQKQNQLFVNVYENLNKLSYSMNKSETSIAETKSNVKAIKTVTEKLVEVYGHMVGEIEVINDNLAYFIPIISQQMPGDIPPDFGIPLDNGMGERLDLTQDEVDELKKLFNQDSEED